MAAILADMPAIGKNQRNQQQGFNFRGIDDVMDALNPLLSKHEVFFVPTVLERSESQRTTGRGGVLYVVNLHVRYRFYGPRGDYVEADGWGEGTDSGDKATNKAMTGAMKYVLFQTFAISTQEASGLDSDRTTPEETTGEPTPDQAAMALGFSSAASEGDIKRRFDAWAKALPEEVKAQFRPLPPRVGMTAQALMDLSDRMKAALALHEEVKAQAEADAAMTPDAAKDAADTAQDQAGAGGYAEA